MESFELTFDEAKKGTGITAISLVKKPAILIDWLAFNDENPQPIQFRSVDDEKMMIAGPVMIPNMDILRVRPETGEKYTVFYTPETVARLNEDFIKSGRQASATVEHQMTVNGVTVIETWIIEDPKKDKSAHYGFSLPKGTWFVVMKVDDQAIWEQVKSGTFKGFSIEGYFSEKQTHSEDIHKDINIKNFISMLSNQIGDFCRQAFGATKEEEKSVQMGTVSVTDSGSNAVELIFPGDELTVGTEVRVLDEAGTEIPAPDGTYTDADGGLWTVAEGKVSEYIAPGDSGESAEGDQAEGESAEQMSAEQVNELISKAVTDMKKAVTASLEKFGELVDQENEKTATEIKELKNSLSKFAATDPIPDTPEAEEKAPNRQNFKDAAAEFLKSKKS